MAKITKKRTAKKTPVIVSNIEEGKSPSVSVKFPKKFFVYGILIIALGGLIYFGGRLLFAAKVNGQLISRVAVVKELEKQGGKKTLDVFILKTLINQEAKKRKISIDKKEIDDEIAKIEKNIASQGVGTLESLLAQQGMTKENLIDEITLQKMVSKMVDGDVKVTDKEVEDYLVARQEAVASSQTPAELPSKEEVREQLKQQKLQEKIQAFVADLKAKAKITYFVNY